MRFSGGAILCATILLTTSAYASGFGLREVSASAFGSSYAGAPAPGGEASTMFFNPALVADVKTVDISSSVLGLLPDATGNFTATTAASTPAGGAAHVKDIVNTALIPSLAVRARLTDRFTVGLQVTAPWGMITDYGPDWVGRYYAAQSDVKTANVTAVAGFQPVPELAFAAGLQVQYIKGRLGKAIDFGTIAAGPPFGLPVPAVTIPGMRDGFVLLKAQNWGLGYVLGLTWTPGERLSLGLSYRSQIDNTLKGTETFDLGSVPVTALGGVTVGQFIAAHTGWFQNGGAQADFSTPASVTFGGRYKITDRLTALASVDWTDWTAFKEVRAVTVPNPYNQPDDVTTMAWKASWYGAVGLEYKNNGWSFRVGTAYDGTPTTDQYRTPGIPDGSRTWLTIGAGVRLTDHMNLDVSYGHLFFQKGNIDLSVATPENRARGSLNGVVNMNVDILGGEVSYHL
ncbi:MAG TPA: outer membrane protein transport protein [Rhizomicrobium sp.]